MKEDARKSSMQSFEIEFNRNIMMSSANHHRLLKFEANFQRTSMIMLISFFAFSIYDTVDFCYSIYLISFLCTPLTILYLVDVLSSLVFWAATVILYLAVKQTSVSRLKRFTYVMIGLVALRLAYAVDLLALDETLFNADANYDCQMSSGQKVWKMILYLFENLFYVISIGSVHYMIQLLESIYDFVRSLDIKEQPSKYLQPDVKESLLE